MIIKHGRHIFWEIKCLWEREGRGGRTLPPPPLSPFPLPTHTLTPVPKRQPRKKKLHTHLIKYIKQICRPHLIYHKILLFWLPNIQTFQMFLLLYLHFMLCQLDLDVLRTQSHHRLFDLSYPQINGVRKSDHMAQFRRLEIKQAMCMSLFDLFLQ